MELLDRYLQAVKKHLPVQRQDDILAELRANLESQLEDKEGELGRPLTSSEAEAWLKQLGAPMQVAARYKPQQYLIGPGLFPMYSFVLRLAALWGMAIYAIVSAVQLAVHVSAHTATTEDVAKAFAESLAQALVQAPFTLLGIATWVTLIFAALEFSVSRGMVKLPAGAPMQPDWRPSDLPPVEVDVTHGKRPRTYAHAVAEVIGGFILLAWLLLFPWHPFLLFGPGVYAIRALPYTLAPIWWTFYWCSVAVNVIELAWRCADLIRNRYQVWNPVQHFAKKIMALIPIAILFSVKGHAYVLLKPGASGEPQLGLPLGQFNDYIFKGMLVVFAILTMQLLWDLWKSGYEDWKQHAGGMK